MCAAEWIWSGRKFSLYWTGKKLWTAFQDLLRSGKISFRVTHNDTKINNVLMDKDTKKGICVIDLDTVMPGVAMNDFGDAVRIGASTALEDEQNLDKVWCDLELFEACAKGFIEGCGGKLSQEEIKLLPMGARLMTYVVQTKKQY